MNTNAQEQRKDAREGMAESYFRKFVFIGVHS